LTKERVYRLLVFFSIIKKSGKTQEFALRELKVFVRVLMLLLFWRTHEQRECAGNKVFERKHLVAGRREKARE